MRGAFNRYLLTGMVRKTRRQVQNAIPLVHVVLMDFRGNVHIWNAIPEVEPLVIVPETGLPLVGAGAERERWKRVREDMDAGHEGELLGGAGPHQLALGIEECDAVLAIGDGLGQ